MSYKPNSKGKKTTVHKPAGEQVMIEELEETQLDIVYDWIIEEEDDINQIK